MCKVHRLLDNQLALPNERHHLKPMMRKVAAHKNGLQLGHRCNQYLHSFCE
jgi:hypothetical protein